jgi:hypothetical protein
MLGIALVFLSLTIIHSRRDPRKNVAALRACQLHLRSLGNALASYRHDFHKPPAKLDDLSRYVLDPASLHCPLEGNGGVRYQYTPGKPTVITCPNHGWGPLILQADGKVRVPLVR